jgi:hypothetical protein
MSTNFRFLKKIDNNLFDIINDAEKLYKDEYFEQCMAQTRRFGEQICKNMMQQNNCETGSFDEMLETLKDRSQGSAQEKEFIDDLYFLKKNGNNAVHSGKVKHEAMTALECLKRSFETALTYCVYNQGAPANILKLNYDVELLITDKKAKKSLKEKYEEEKTRQNLEKSYKKQSERTVKTEEDDCFKPQKKIEIPLFWKMIIFLCGLSGLIVLVLSISISLKTFLTAHF